MNKERYKFHNEVKEIKKDSIDEEHFLDNLQAYFDDYVDKAFDGSEKADQLYQEGYEQAMSEMEDDLQKEYNIGVKQGIKQFITKFKSHTDEIISTKEGARQYLIELGIYTEDGNLSENYK